MSGLLEPFIAADGQKPKGIWPPLNSTVRHFLEENTMRTGISAAVALLLAYSAILMAQSSVYLPPPASARVLEGINFKSASPVNESYRAKFDRCDRENIFKSVRMTGFRECTRDPNRVRALLRFPDKTIFFESKLGLDIDGSWKACHDRGPTDQCPTWFKWGGLPVPDRYVDSDKFPYVVIPISDLRGRDDPEFRDKTGINQGDLGVVVYKDKLVPVFVADGGPHNKLGEGSASLFKALGEDRCSKWRSDDHCERYRDFSLEGGVLFFLFPNSQIEGLNPGNALEKIRNEALARFEGLKRR